MNTLQSDLDSISQRSISNLMPLNMDKTMCMTFSRTRNVNLDHPRKYTFGGIEVKKVAEIP
jgi:hypothetical protein